MKLVANHSRALAFSSLSVLIVDFAIILRFEGGTMINVLSRLVFANFGRCIPHGPHYE
jgi:hypothetical protein